MQTVGDRFEAGRLVDHVLGCRELAGVVKPTGHFKFVPLVIGQLEVGKRSLVRLVGCAGKVLCDLRYPLAVTVGVRRLGIDRSRHHVDDGVEQIFLGLEQSP